MNYAYLIIETSESSIIGTKTYVNKIKAMKCFEACCKENNVEYDVADPDVEDCASWFSEDNDYQVFLIKSQIEE